MGKKRTEKSRYESKYSPDGYVTPAQYICEIICEAKARTEGKELPFKFWQLDEWAKFYRSQINSANSLLKKYSDKAILAVLKDGKNSKTFSLRAKWLIPQFIEADNKIKSQEAKIQLDLAEKKDREVNVVVGTNKRPEMKSKGRFGELE